LQPDEHDAALHLAARHALVDTTNAGRFVDLLGVRLMG
jgi:hypothetical protein